MLTSRASTYRPTRSIPPPFSSSPAISATIVTTVIVVTERTRAEIQYPPTIPFRLVAPSISRRAKPDSKSRATENPMKMPPTVDAWSSTKP